MSIHVIHVIATVDDWETGDVTDALEKVSRHIEEEVEREFGRYSGHESVRVLDIKVVP